MSIKMLYEKDGTTPMGSALNVGYLNGTATETALTSGIEFQAPSNGHIIISGNSPGTDAYTELKLHIDGLLIFASSGRLDQNSSHFSRDAIPVRKGQKVIATFPTGGGASFYPDQET